MTQQTFDTLTIALSYLRYGLSIIPIAPGSKHPATDLLPLVWDEEKDKTVPTWKPYQSKLAHRREVERWFRERPDAGIGIVGGLVSGGLVIIDLESVEAYDTWRENAAALAGQQLVTKLPVVATGKGRHVYYRCERPIGNRKLATLGKSVIAETRGEGGYVLAPPSRHPSGATYTLISGDLTDIPLVTEATALALIDAARALTPAAPHPAGRTGDVEGGSVIEAYNKAHTIESVLEANGYTADGSGRYIRPGGERGSVVITGGRSAHYNTSDPLHSESPGGGVHSHSPFSAFAVLKHQGDIKAAVKAAAAELGMSREPNDDHQLLDQAGRGLGLGQRSPADTWPYFAHEGGIWLYRTEKDGSPRTPLPMTNWTATIESEINLNDGEHIEERYSITATCGKRQKRIELSRAEFESEAAVGRIVAALGAKARVNPAAQTRYIIDAIKAFSHEIREHTMHTHVGWVDGRYLVGNGYIDAEGWHPATSDTATRAHLPAKLERYRLCPPADATIADGLALFDDLLELAPHSTMVPLLGAVLLAPIAPAIDAPAPMVHVYGPTGTHKTSVSCAALALFGDFTPAHPTDTWTSTGKSIQRLGWHLKDAPMLLDDYKAAHVKPNEVTFLLQNYGDNMARGRLGADSEVRTAFPVRAVLISSGEDQPEGEASTLARILSVGMSRGSVHLGKLTQIQSQGNYLHRLTMDYLGWLASAADGGLKQLHQEARGDILRRLQGAENATNPGRVASNAAILFVSWRRFCAFLVERGHWTEDRAAAWLDTCRRELLGLAKRQLELTTNERYSQLFLEALQSLIASGRAVILPSAAAQADPGRIPIGYQADNGVFVFDAAYDEVAKHYRQAGRQISFTKRALAQMLDQDGLLVTKQAPGLAVRRRVNGAPVWCWHLPSGVVD